MNCPHVPPGRVACRACINAAADADKIERRVQLLEDLVRCDHVHAQVLSRRPDVYVQWCGRCGAIAVNGGSWVRTGLADAVERAR